MNETESKDILLHSLRADLRPILSLPKFQKFLHPAPPTQGPLSKVVDAYQEYWRRNLTKIEVDPIESWTRILSAALGFEEDDLENKIAALIREEGWRCQLGVTSPLHDLLVWKNEKKETFEVELKDCNVTIEVVFMHEFISRGWLSYATLGTHAAGGWAKPESLYCVASEYDVTSEDFLVNYLAHEARHASDNRKFTHLKGADLEYRAKLTQLSLARETLRKILNQFQNNAADDPNSPHALANFRLVRDMEDVLSMSDDELRAKAFELILKDNELHK